MYKIKQNPEDFLVREITNLYLKNSGVFLVCILKKRNYTTIRAIEQIARVLGVKANDIGFAGIKDKNALTEQYISIKNVKREEIQEIRLKDIELGFIGYCDNPLSLGDLEENEFTITLRDFKGKVDLDKRMMPNFFGEQRFSKNNVIIGKSLLKSNFKEARRLILETNPDYKEKMEEFMGRKPNDLVGALKLIPTKLLKLYAHAYQSHLWNMTSNEYIKKNKKNVQIPLIGFCTEIKDKEINRIIMKIMKKEDVTFRGFINRSIPEISLEGDLRDAFVEIKNLEVVEKGKDFVKIKFRLPKGSYATVAVGFLLN